MEFEYNPQKSGANAAKHGIDFEAARALWDDWFRVEIPSKFVDEPRTLLIARLEDRIWAAIYTQRADSIRIISVRRARTQEVELYEELAQQK